MPEAVVTCPRCGGHYRKDRQCPKCEHERSIVESRRNRRASRLAIRQSIKRAEALQRGEDPYTPRPKRIKPTLESELADHPNLYKWLARHGHVDPIKARWPQFRQRLRKYDLSVVRWAEFVVARNSRCHICERELPPLKLHIDHDHHTLRVRGLLCPRCNTGIGSLGIDGPQARKRAAAIRNYLDSPEFKSAASE